MTSSIAPLDSRCPETQDSIAITAWGTIGMEITTQSPLSTAYHW